MYFPDLSPYAYIGVEPSTLTVGWLDAVHPFLAGESSSQFIDRLRTFLLTPVKQTRGFHRRPFCSDPMARSSAEIRVEESRPHLRGTALICLPDTIDSRGPRGK